MITIPHVLAARLAAVLRASLPAALHGGCPLPVLLESGPGGLVLRAQHEDLAVELRHRRPGPEAALCLPAAALADFRGRDHASVTLEPDACGGMRASWQERGSPRVRLYTAPAPVELLPFPAEPGRLARAPRGLGRALIGAAQTAARPGTDPVLTRWLLCRGRRELISCDGVQLLLQGGIRFPWQEDLLVAALPACAARRLAGGPVLWGRGARHVCLRHGPWSFHLAIDKWGRYPAVARALAQPQVPTTRVRLAPADAALLVCALARLRRSPLQDEPLTLDLDGHPVVHLPPLAGEAACTLALRRSGVLGPPVRLRTAHSYLLRAVRLGFRQLTVAGQEGPLVCRQGRRRFVWMPLGLVTAPVPA